MVSWGRGGGGSQGGGWNMTTRRGAKNYRWQNIKDYKGKTNSAQSVLANLLWLLYQPGTAGSTHRPHMYPTPGRAWEIGVVWGCAKAVPARPPSPLTPLLHCGNPTLRKRRRRHHTFSILSSIIMWRGARRLYSERPCWRWSSFKKQNIYDAVNQILCNWKKMTRDAKQWWHEKKGWKNTAMMRR